VLYLGGLVAALVTVVLLAGTRLVTAGGAVAVDGPALFLQGATVLVAIGAGVLIGERSRVGAAAGASSGSVGASATARRPVLAGFAPQAALAPGGDAEREAERAGVSQTEVFPLALFATGGLMLFPAANDLITLFIALEVLSLPLYVM
ncbi:NADH-quinone oxidoreductase subunit N, partial [Mycobacterium tuberculosis]|nr:NADH-quinone oxidoreductase subunit N [Mycobacterium tuberculosis]